MIFLLDYLCHKVNCGRQCSGENKRPHCSFPTAALQGNTETLKPFCRTHTNTLKAEYNVLEVNISLTCKIQNITCSFLKDTYYGFAATT